MNIGLLSVTASVYQMMRGAEMLFAALFAVLFLHRHLNKYHLLGILCCVVGSNTYIVTVFVPLRNVCGACSELPLICMGKYCPADWYDTGRHAPGGQLGMVTGNCSAYRCS